MITIIKIFFWFNLSLIFFIYFAFPIILFIIAKLKGRQVDKEETVPLVSLIIPMHNEEKTVKEKVDNVLTLDYPDDKLEIIFALDGCTDRTKEILLEYDYRRINIVEILERSGKVAAMNKAVLQAKGEIVVFSDTNSMHNKDTLRKLLRSFTDKDVGCACGRLSYTYADSTSVGRGENLYWKYETFIKKQESRLGKLLITNGSIQAVRREIYPFPDPEIADDFSIPILIQAKGYKVIYEPAAVVYEIATQSLKEEFNQKIRIISQGFKGTIKLWKDLLELKFLGMFEFIFHKLLRWFIFVFLMVIFLSNLMLIDNNLYLNLFIVQIAFYSFAFIGFLLRHNIRIKIFYIPFYFCLVNSASLVALFRFLKGEQTRIWEKAHTTRVNKPEKLKSDRAFVK